MEQQQSFIHQFQAQQQRTRHTYHSLHTCLDQMLSLYSQAQLSLHQPHSQPSTLQRLNQQLIGLKPIKSVRDHFVHHYRKLSTLLRKTHLKDTKNAWGSARTIRKRGSEISAPLASRGSAQAILNNVDRGEMINSRDGGEIVMNSMGGGEVKINSRGSVQGRLNSRVSVQDRPSSKAPDQVRFNQLMDDFLKGEKERESLHRMIVQHFLREGKWQQSAVWQALEQQIDPNALFRECFAIREAVMRGQMEEAIRWCESQKLFQTHGTLLEYQLKKTHILGLVERGQMKRALDYYTVSMSKFHKVKQTQIQKLVLCILVRGDPVWRQQLPQQIVQFRYLHLNYSQVKCIYLAQQFRKQFFRHNQMSQFDAMQTVYQCSQQVEQQYRRMMGLMWHTQSNHNKSKHKEKHIHQEQLIQEQSHIINQKGNKQQEKGGRQLVPQVLPFSVNLPRQNEYHSLLLCPVTKEVHSGRDGSVLLSCGHLISEAAHSRIVLENRNRRKVKCPICQKELRAEENIKAEF